MMMAFLQGTSASTLPAALLVNLQDSAIISPDQARHMLFGTPDSVQSTIARLHKLGYAEPNDWSRLLSTGRSGEVMAILTKRVAT